MSNPKQILVNCITLITLENRPDSPASRSTELIKDVIKSIPLKEATTDVDHGRQTFYELRELTVQLNAKTKEEYPSIQEILQMVRVACRDEVFLYDAIEKVVMEDFPDGASVMRRVSSYRNALQHHLNEESIKNLFKEYSGKILFNNGRNGSMLADVYNELADRLEPFVKARGAVKHPAEMGAVDFGNPNELIDVFQDAGEQLSPDGAFKTGWKCINRMLGEVGAIKRGEFVTCGGLQHNYKTGWVMSLFIHAALFNKPFMRDPAKKPLLLFVTLENEIPGNVLWMYEYLKENETGEKVDRNNINYHEASQYVSMRLRENGFDVRMHRFDPTDFTITSFTNWLDSVQSEGYEIQYLVIDYLNMLSKSGIDTKVAGDDIRLMFRKLRNYTSPRGIACITPHQLSSDALELTRNNTEDFVKIVANKGYWDGCRRLGQEPDLEFLFHIVEMNGKKYLTIARGKHRYTVTATKHLYTAMEFKPVGSLPWDIDKEVDYGISVLGRATGGADESDDFW